MGNIQIKLTVYFDGTFWIGVFEKLIASQLSVVKVTFGSEPKNIEIYNFVLNKYQYLKFSDSINVCQKTKKDINPKRKKKLAKKQVVKELGTKSQLALKLQQEQGKTNRKFNQKQKKEEISKLKFEIRKKKKAQKHKGQ